jgi:hypothetical protein
MKRWSFVTVVVGVIAAAAVPAPASATDAAADGSAATCRMRLGYVTSDGAQGGWGLETPRVFEPGSVRLSTTFSDAHYNTGTSMEGWVVKGDSLYWRTYSTDLDGWIDPQQPDYTLRIGGGWTNYTALEVAQYRESSAGKPSHTIAYGLRNDGTLFRWSVAGDTAWRRTGSATGFAAVKSMTLISKTRTYDTFLANTRGGALYTIHIPVTSPMKPIVRPVRTRTWQGFEQLVASKCGQYGTILIGIDKDTKTAYQYAVGHANGTATVIQSLGKIQGTFDDPVYHRWAEAGDDPLNGE